MKKAIRIIITLARFPVDIWQMFITYLPGPVGFKLRYVFWKKRLKFLGKNVKIDIGVYFHNSQCIEIYDNCWIDRNVIILAGKPGLERVTFFKESPEHKGKEGEVHIGKNTHIAPNCVLSGMGGLYIGKNCGIASNTSIYSFSHHYRNLSNKDDSGQYSFTPLARLDQQAMISGPVVIDDYCAVGLNSVLLPGSWLMKGSWVSSGSVISKKYSKQSLIFGNKKLDTKDLGHLKIKE